MKQFGTFQEKGGSNYLELVCRQGERGVEYLEKFDDVIYGRPLWDSYQSYISWIMLESWFQVAGNFHIAPGKSFQQSNVHVHDVQSIAGLKVGNPNFLSFIPSFFFLFQLFLSCLFLLYSNICSMSPVFIFVPYSNTTYRILRWFCIQIFCFIFAKYFFFQLTSYFCIPIFLYAYYPSPSFSPCAESIVLLQYFNSLHVSYSNILVPSTISCSAFQLASCFVLKLPLYSVLHLHCYVYLLPSCFLYYILFHPIVR